MNEPIEKRYEVAVKVSSATVSRTVWVWARDEEHARQKAAALAIREAVQDGSKLALRDKPVMGDPITRKLSLEVWTSTGREVSSLVAQADEDDPSILSE